MAASGTEKYCAGMDEAEHAEESSITWREARVVVAVSVAAGLAVVIASVAGLASPSVAPVVASSSTGHNLADGQLLTYAYHDPNFPAKPHEPIVSHGKLPRD